MKKFIIIICLIIICFFTATINPKASGNLNINDYIMNNENYYFENDNFIIYGNYNNLKNSNIEESIKNLKSRTLIIYFTMDGVQNNYKLSYYGSQLTLINFNNGIINEMSYKTTYKDVNYLKEEYNNFYIEKIIENNSSITNVSRSSSLFTAIKTGSDRLTGSEYGYIDVSYVISRYNVNSYTSLYYIEFITSLTCGKMAYDNGNSSYNDEALHSGVKVNLLPVQAENWDDAYYNDEPRRGGVPVLKDYWPTISAGKTTISSTYSSNSIIGYSFVNGFSLTNSYTTQNGTQIGSNILESYEKRYTSSNPILSTQLSSTNSSMVEWNYTEQTDTDITYSVRDYYMFEMNDTNHTMNIGDFDLTYKVVATFKVPDYILFFIRNGWDYYDVELNNTVNIWNNNIS